MATERPGPYANEVGEAIYQTRSSIAALAKATDTARQDMSEIVNGWRLPGAGLLDRMVEVLGWSADRLYPTQAFRDAIAATRRANDEAGERIA